MGWSLEAIVRHEKKELLSDQNCDSAQPIMKAYSSAAGLPKCHISV